MPVTRPVNLIKPFANTGGKNTIPNASQIGITAGLASYEDGFPPLTRTPLSAGGVPPFGQDMNGILFALSQHTTFMNSGGQYQFDSALATAIGGYPVGFVLQNNAGTKSYVNILANNTTDFNSTPAAIGVSWMPYSGGFDYSIGSSGYQKLPSGLILQWGIGNTSASADVAISFNIAFPNFCRGVYATESSASTNGAWAATNSRTASGFNLSGWTTASGRTAFAVDWFALGH